MKATTMTISPALVESLRTRRAAGEKLSALAGEVGLSWQKLWEVLNGTARAIAKAPRAAAAAAPKAQPPAPGALAKLERGGGPGPLTERYRPRSLETIWGQGHVVRHLRSFAAEPYGTAFLFEGPTGTGKTSAAVALAGALGCDVAQEEFGGVHTIASGDQSADNVRKTAELMYLTPFHGSGWKVFIVNEVDRMSLPAETIWLDILEAIPGRSVIVFTTNDTGRLSARFRDRCTRLSFSSTVEALRAPAVRLAGAIWKAETHRRPRRRAIESIVDSAAEGGYLSFRRVVQKLTVALSQEREGE